MQYFFSFMIRIYQDGKLSNILGYSNMLRTHLIFIIGCENCDRNKKSISSNNGLKCFHFKIRFAILTYSHLLGDPKKFTPNFYFQVVPKIFG